MNLSVIIANIDQGAIALPQFQRGYVWSTAQVRSFMDALYRGYPVGSLLTWQTSTEGIDFKGNTPPQPGSVQLLVDGQQRITTLYGLIKGVPPPFFEGTAKVIQGLRFHLEDETFEFWQPVKMRADPLWLDVTEFFQMGAGVAIARLTEEYKDHPQFATWINRLNRLDSIKTREFHVEQIAGDDKTIDVVVDIFNRVNTGGTKLSKGDLALAKICAEWPEARTEMRRLLDEWAQNGFDDFSLDWLLRVVTGLLTGQARFVSLAGVTPSEFAAALKRAKKAIDTVLNEIGARLGVNDASVLPNAFALLPLARFVDLSGGKFSDPAQRDRLLYWYLQASMWGRYAGNVETALTQDLSAVINDSSDPTDRLLAYLRRQRGDLKVRPGDFWGYGRGSRFYPILYVLTRVTGARDWGTGVPLSKLTLGAQTNLEVHHIFPKSLLYEAEYSRAEVNAIANFTFLTKETNLAISNRQPAEYLPKYAALHKNPDGDSPVAGHWLPLEPSLWEISTYRDFLERRRVLLADAMNALLNELHSGHMPETLIEAIGRVSDTSNDEEAIVADLKAWIVEQGLSSGTSEHEITDANGTVLAVLDIAWPAGLQTGLSEPVALLLNEPPETIKIANDHGYRVLTTTEAMRDYCATLITLGAMGSPDPNT